VTACLSPNGLNRYDVAEAPRRLFVATAEGVAILRRNDRSWAVESTGLSGKHISSLLFDASTGALFAGVHGGGLYRSDDEGHTWRERMNGITSDHVYSLMSIREDGHTVLYAGTEPARLFRSDDQGDTWRELPSLRDVPETDKWMFPAPPHAAHMKSLAIDPRSPSTLYAGIEQGALLLSTDAGATWTELDGYARPDDEVYKDIHLVMLRPSNPDEIFMTAGMGLYHSADRGQSWEHLSTRRARVGYPDQFQFAPGDDSVMFMAGAATNPGTWRQSHHAQSTVMRSTDAGRTWQEKSEGLPAPLRDNIEAMALAAAPGGYELYIGTTDGDVYASADAAEHWTLIGSGLAPISKGGHYVPLAKPAA